MTDAAPPVPAEHSPLHDRHLALGAKMADFGGWLMPIEYPDGGVLKEHAAVRSAVGLFDVSHLGKASVVGPGAVDFLDGALTNSLGRVTAGQAQYTLCCAESGGVVDDLIVYRVSDDELFLVPNAANTSQVVSRLEGDAPAAVRVTNLHREFGVLAVQGPASASLLERVGLPHEHPYMSFVQGQLSGRWMAVCRTGYTGEHGFELLPRWEDTGPVWDELMAAGADLGLRPCGLGARDTLRTEMGYPLHGQDLSEQITPVQAGLVWAVGWDKPAFWGRQALLAEREAGPRRRLRGLLALDRAIPRPRMRVFAAPGTATQSAGLASESSESGEVLGVEHGEVTSGTFSPTLRKGIGLALLDRSVTEGIQVMVDVRGRPSPMRVVRPPFVQPTGLR